jgi:hypothetical protein
MYSKTMDENTPLLRNRFKPKKVKIEENLEEYNTTVNNPTIINTTTNPAINNKLVSYLLDNIKINNNRVYFNNSEDQLKEDIIRICQSSTDNFNLKQISDYIMEVCNTFETSDNLVFHIHRLKAYGLSTLYLVNNIFCYINYMFSGARYNYHTINGICFEFVKLNITQEQIDNIKNKDIIEISNLIILLLNCNKCEFGNNRNNDTPISIEEIIII